MSDQTTDNDQKSSPNAVGRPPSAKAHGARAFRQSENERQPAENADWTDAQLNDSGE